MSHETIELEKEVKEPVVKKAETPVENKEVGEVSQKVNKDIIKKTERPVEGHDATAIEKARSEALSSFPSNKEIPTQTINRTPEELAELQAKQEEFRKPTMGDIAANIFKSNEQKKMRENAEGFANNYLFEIKDERDFIVKFGNKIDTWVNKGAITKPTQEEIENILREAKMEKFNGSITNDAIIDAKKNIIYKVGKLLYKNEKDIKLGNSLSGGGPING